MQSSRKAAECGNLVLQTLVSSGQSAIACGVVRFWFYSDQDIKYLSEQQRPKLRAGGKGEDEQAILIKFAAFIPSMWLFPFYLFFYFLIFL